MDGDGSDYEVNEGPDGSSFSDEVVRGFRYISDELKSAEEGSVGQQVGSDSNDVVEKEKRPEELHKGGMGEKEDAGNKKDVAGAGSAVKTAVTGAGAAVGAAKAGGILARVGKFGPIGIIIIVIIVLATASFIAMPLMIGTIKENLIKALGFEDTVAILEKAAEYKIGGALSKGEMPDGLAADFLAQGIEVGQVTLAGDFVRTNKYLAELDGVEVAANGEYYGSSKGELAVRFKNEIIKADDFVVAVESSPELYAAYSEGLDIATRYYYSDEVNEVYNTMGVNRSAFSEWESTGNAQEDQKKFEELLAKNLDIDFNLNTYGEYNEIHEYTNDDGETIQRCEGQTWDYSSVGSGEKKASGLMSAVVGGSRKNDNGTARENAAQFLNMTVSAGEPYLAANVFMTTVGLIERAQVGDNGPVNELMNTLTMPTEITYTDVSTGETKVENKSILETTNFVAAVTDGTYSKEEANNFSRDRVFRATNFANQKVIGESVVSMAGEKSSSGFTMNNNCGEEPPTGLEVATDGVRLALTEKSSDTFPSIVGGNRVIEGGSFISNSLNQHVLGAMPSDSSVVMAYQGEVNRILARRAEADRTTKSPFDTSSPNTFMGSLVRNLASVIIKKYDSSDRVSFGGISGLMAGLFNDSAARLVDEALADSEEDRFTSLKGDCDTVEVAANVIGDLYCNSRNTMSMEHMDYTEDDWKRELNSVFGEQVIDENGEIVKTGAMAKFIVYGADREATVGVKSDVICQRFKEEENEEGGLFGGIGNFFKKIYRVLTSGSAQALEKNCSEVPDDLATGARYTLSSSNSGGGSEIDFDKVKLLSAYMLHDRVKSFLTEEESAVTAFRKEYYEAHPLDNSYEGRLARISGLSVDEVKIALGYQEFLTRIAQYNPQERYNFVAIMEPPKDALQFSKDTNTAIGIYGLWSRRFEHADTRNRVYLV